MIYSFSTFGYETPLVKVEVDLRRGIPSVDIVGLADDQVKRTRERVRSAITNQGFSFPDERVLIALSPADLRKYGSCFDLAIALEIIAQKDDCKPFAENVLVIGELALNGEVRAVRAINAALQTAMNCGIDYAIVPHTDNLKVPYGMKVACVADLKEAVDRYLSGGFTENTVKEDKELKIEFDETVEGGFDTIEGMNGLKYATAVAVAGRHNILAYGRPGCGKTLTLQSARAILPKLTADEKPSVDRIYSIAGLEGVHDDSARPFRIPHQTASIEGMCGGGIQCRPGEITLAHNGILFLNEAAEFRNSALQMLRVPLECHSITLTRAGRTTVFPADFQLFMATNLCPCGNYGNPDKICLCSLKSIEMYWKKFSAPLLDRIEIRYDCNKEDNSAYISQEDFKRMIAEAWKRQYARQGKLNGKLTVEEIDKYIVLDEYAKIHFNRKVEAENMSLRRRANILKLARTIQDINDGKDKIDDVSLCMALMLNRKTVLENL